MCSFGKPAKITDLLNYDYFNFAFSDLKYDEQTSDFFFFSSINNSISFQRISLLIHFNRNLFLIKISQIREIDLKLILKRMILFILLLFKISHRIFLLAFQHLI